MALSETPNITFVHQGLNITLAHWGEGDSKALTGKLKIVLQQKSQEVQSRRRLTTDLPTKSPSSPGNPSHRALWNNSQASDWWLFHEGSTVQRYLIIYIALIFRMCIGDIFPPMLSGSCRSQSDPLCVWNLCYHTDSEKGRSQEHLDLSHLLSLHLTFSNAHWWIYFIAFCNYSMGKQSYAVVPNLGSL